MTTSCHPRTPRAERDRQLRLTLRGIYTLKPRSPRGARTSANSRMDLGISSGDGILARRLRVGLTGDRCYCLCGVQHRWQ